MTTEGKARAMGLQSTDIRDKSINPGVL